MILMEGSVRKRGDKWYYSFEIPNQEGKRKRVERVGGKTKKEAQALLSLALAEYTTTGKVIIETKDSYDTIFNEFITNEGEMTRKFSTLKRFKSLHENHLKAAFGNLPVANISSETIQSFLGEKKLTHSAEYVRSMNNLLFVIFKYAERMKKIKVSPMIGVVAPAKPKESDVATYTDAELTLLKDRLESTNVKRAFTLGLHLGVRSGECYGLRWSDFDFEKCTVKIERQLQEYNGVWCFTTLKTQNSYRTLTFGSVLKEYLLKAKEMDDLAKDHYGEMYKTNKIMDEMNVDKKEVILVNDFVNIKPTGEMLTPYSHKVISRIAKDEFNIDFKFHNLRHTHATKLLESGMNPKYVQERLGHAKLEFTLRIYTHITANMETQAATIMDSRFPI
jgi:integrase